MIAYILFFFFVWRQLLELGKSLGGLFSFFLFFSFHFSFFFFVPNPGLFSFSFFYWVRAFVCWFVLLALAMAIVNK